MAAIRAEGELDKQVAQRYGNWDSGMGAEIEAGRQSFGSLETYMLEKGEAQPNKSGRQEAFENLVNRYVI